MMNFVNARARRGWCRRIRAARRRAAARGRLRAPAPARRGDRGSRRVPAQDAVDRAVACGNASWRAPGSASQLAVADVPIEIREDVLDENLAAELLAEEADVAADDRPEVEQHRRLARGRGTSGTCGAPWWRRRARRPPPARRGTHRPSARSGAAARRSEQARFRNEVSESASRGTRRFETPGHCFDSQPDCPDAPTLR